MQTLAKTITIINAFLTIFHCFALGLTAFRLHYRYRTRRLWWDDYLAAISAVLDFVTFIVLWLDYAPPGSHIDTIRSKKIIDWIGLVGVSGTDWMTRISLALAFARIFPRGEPTRAYTIGLAILFAMGFLSIIIQRTIVCSKSSAWLVHPGFIVRCNFTARVVIYTVVANIVADLLLVCFPIYKLRKVKLPQSQRRLIFACVAGSTLMSVCCFATSMFQIGPLSRGPSSLSIRALLGHFESGISVIVCNLLVVVAYLYTVTHKQQIVPQVNVEPQTSPTIPTTTRQTTIQSTMVSQSTTTTGSIFTRYTLTEISTAYLTRTDAS